MKELIIKIDKEKMDIEGNAPLVDRPQELVRCKDCKHRGNRHKCVVAFIASKHDMPVGFYDRNGEWFCADGVRR